MSKDEEIVLENYRKSKMRKKRKNLYGKLIVFFVIMLNSLFAIGVLAVYWHTGSEPTALIAAWFSFTTGELLMMAGIKYNKIKSGSNDDNNLGA